MKKAKPVLVLVLKLVVSVGLLAYFLARIHIERFLQTFANAKFSYIALVMLVYLFTQGISAARWTTLARPLGIKTPFTAMLRYYLIGMFFNLFAPGTVGGDVSRVYYLVKDEDARAKGHAVTTVNAAMSVLMDRAIGMIVLVWLGALGLWLFPYYAVPTCGAGRDFPTRPGISCRRLTAACVAARAAARRPSAGGQVAARVQKLSNPLVGLIDSDPIVAFDSSDSSLDTRGDGTRARFKRAVFFRPHRISAGRDLFRDPH